MKIYWGLSSIPELASVPKAERRRLCSQANQNVRNTPATLLRLLLSGLCAGTCAGIGALLGDFTGSDYGIIGAGIGGGIGGMVYGQLTIRGVLPHLRELIDKEISTVGATSL